MAGRATALQIGKNRSDGIALSPLAQLAKRIDGGPTLGFEYYGSLGSTDKLAFSIAGQTVGPFLSTRLVGQTSILAGVQFGLTEAAPDTDIRLWITQGF